VKYLENCEEMRNDTKELKFLDIDFNKLKDKLKDKQGDENEEDENYGIEKGYEQFLYNTSDSDDCSKSNKKKKRKNYRTPSQSVSYSDTGTQNRTDSVGSDGLGLEKPRRKSPRDHLRQMLHNRNKETASSRGENEVAYGKIAPRLSTLNLNPCIVLIRTDVSHQDLKSSRVFAEANNRPGNLLSHITPDIISRRPSQSKNLPYDIDGKNQIPISRSLVGDVSGIEYTKNDLLVKSVPGLNSLDVIESPPSEATVQVVQSGVATTKSSEIPETATSASSVAVSAVAGLFSQVKICVKQNFCQSLN
jgi:hypothetical protein